MWRGWLCVVFLLGACEDRKPQEKIALPDVRADEIVVSWGYVSRDPSRSTLNMELLGNRDMAISTKSPDGTLTRIERNVGEDEYAHLVATLRKLDCCSLRSQSETAPSPLESKPELTINFGDLQCAVALWDSEWRVGRARECGFAVAQVHGSGFVPDPPPDEAAP